MAEYRRIVSYLYKYTNGQKGENVGFVRIETRADGLRLFFHVKDLRMMDERNIKAYFYFHEGEQKKAIFVDEFLCSRGNCEYKETKKEKELLGDKELLDLDGMVFYDSKGLLYGTCWDEREIIEGNIVFPEKEIQEEKEPKENIEPKKKEEKSEEFQKEEQIEKDETKEEGNLRMEEMPKSKMEQILEEAVPVPIQWDSGLVKAVKIKPEDISKFPIQDWHLAENRFLLQGYEIHKYLILGRIEMNPGRYLWVLGVPGIYNNREKYLAGIFGFHDYIPMEQGKLKTGGNGFWITPCSK